MSKVFNVCKTLGKRAVFPFVLFCCSTMVSYSQTQEYNVKLSGGFKDLKDQDTVVLIRYEHPFFGTGKSNEIIEYTIVKNQRFVFNIKLRGATERCKVLFPQYLSKYNWIYGALEKGHDINLGENNGQLFFSGPGVDLIKYDKALDAIYMDCWKNIDWEGARMPHNIEIVKSAADNMLLLSKENLNYNKKSFSVVRWSQLTSLLAMLYSIANNYPDSAKSVMQKADADLKEKYLSTLFNYKDLDQISVFPSFVNVRYKCLYENADIKYKIEGFRKYNQYLRRSFKEPVLTQLVVAFLNNKKNSDQLTPDFIDEVTRGLNITPYQDVVQKIIKFTPGSLLPEFVLFDTLKNKVNISRYRGEVLLLDFWYTGCGACAISHKILEPLMAEFRTQPVKLISISRDKDFSAWKNSIYSGRYTTPEDINLSAGSIGEGHGLFRYLDVNSYPTFIIIDKQGKVLGSPVPPNVDQGKDLKTKLTLALSK
ncbi:TlpA family protein disulfide reductase [Elizabethkingia anophelis]|uniref:TlpA family protein disulfide reductase n=1 Tax=Elizabethkingia anophelis TaxID=1117645 RepID=UPI00136B2173|nr:TlpA disulfide reductase family protein [Elizabethkingia anophelis]MYY43951.1 TlpA family protein disulfide reductase [Elizabethkingia anophelis]